ncbi:MAG: hypothetical protein ACO3JL_17230 [Myxococcota bacterium]
MALRPACLDPCDDHPSDLRRQVPLAEGERLGDVASRTFADPRVLPLFALLNPGMAADAPARRGALVTVPSRAEAVRYARARGFQLGRVTEASLPLDRGRRWETLRDGVPTRTRMAPGPEVLCVALAREGASSRDIARRMETAFPADTLEAFLVGAHELPLLREVALELRRMMATRQCVAVFGQLRALLMGTCSPVGRRLVAMSACRWPERLREVMSALLVDDTIQCDLLKASAVIGPQVDEAVRRARQPVWERVLAARLGDREEPTLGGLVTRVVHGFEPLDDDALGTAKGCFESLELHLARLRALLETSVKRLDVAPVEVLEAVAAGSTRVPMAAPWPVVAVVVERGRGWLSILNVDQRAEGIGRLAELLAHGSAGASPHPMAIARFTGAAVAARRNVGEGSVQRHEETAARLAPVWLRVLSTVLPAAERPLGGRPAARQRLEGALLVPRLEEVRYEDVSRAIHALVDTLPTLSLGQQGKRRLRSTALGLASRWTSPLPVGNRRASPLARGALLVAAVIDTELGPSCAAGNQHDFVVAALQRYGGAIISTGLQISITAGDQSSAAIAGALRAPINPGRLPGWLPS